MKSKTTVIPDPIRKELKQDPFYLTCSLFGHHGHTCDGRITWEHALVIGGKKLQLKWGIIPLCAKGHEVDQFQDGHSMIKEMNEWVALSRASVQDILDLFGEAEVTSLSKSRLWTQRRTWLIQKYGEYKVIPQKIRYGLRSIGGHFEATKSLT